MKKQDPVSMNLNVRGLKQSATLEINERSKKKRSGYRLGLGQSPFPVPDTVVESLRANAGKKEYLPSNGLPQLRRAVAQYHHRKDHVDSKSDSVLIGPGSKELMFLLQLVYYGEILIPSPCWVSYVPQANIIGRQVYLIQTTFRDKWSITGKALDRFCRGEQDPYRPRILILNYPGNPDGCTYKDKQLRELAQVARKYRMIILSDEIYGPLHHQGKHVSIARYYPEGTIISGGLSKWCGAGGWRLGTFTFPPELEPLYKAMANVASETFTSVSAPIQYAAVSAFRGDQKIERYLWHVRRILAALGKQCYRILSEADVKLWEPEGAFYLFPDFSAYAERLRKRNIAEGSEQMCDCLFKDTGVAILPGKAFSRPPEELTARIAYVDFDGAKALTASELVPLDQPLPDDFVEYHCTTTLKAVRSIVEWLRQ